MLWIDPIARVPAFWLNQPDNDGFIILPDKIWQWDDADTNSRRARWIKVFPSDLEIVDAFRSRATYLKMQNEVWSSAGALDWRRRNGGTINGRFRHFKG